MEDLLQNALSAGNVGICVKNVDGMVLSQNDGSTKSCGNQVGVVCLRLCRHHIKTSSDCEALTEGVHLFPCVKNGTNYFDLIIMSSKQHIISLLYPLEQKHQDVFAYYKSKGLSKRELEVGLLVLQGKTNSEIIEKLHISKGTVKTHLNNIYKKLEESDALCLLRDTRNTGHAQPHANAS